MLERCGVDDVREIVTARSVKKELINDAEIIAKEMGLQPKTVNFARQKERQIEKELTLEEWQEQFLDRMSS
jgi:hypothetical protein